MKSMTIALLGLAGIAAFSVQAQPKPDEAPKLRQAVMRLMSYNLGSLGAMVNNKKPYNKDEAIRNASRLENLVPQHFEFFVAGSDKGETKAKAEIWKDPEKFNAGAEKLQAESVKLAEVAKSGDLTALKTQFGTTAQTCKACHDNYREK
jgi:cytochrome c556